MIHSQGCSRGIWCQRSLSIHSSVIIFCLEHKSIIRPSPPSSILGKCRLLSTGIYLCAIYLPLSCHFLVESIHQRRDCPMSTCLATLIVCTGYINSMHGKMINLWKCFVTFVSCSRAKVQRRILFPSLNFFRKK